MLLLSREDIKKVFTMKDALEADKEAFILYSQGKSTVPLRTNIGIGKHSGQSLFMPAYVEDLDSAGIKIVSVFPKNLEIGKPSLPAKMVLIDGKNGEICCIMDGTYLTQLRTGAASGTATELLARQDAKKGMLFGTGGQAATQLEAMLTVRKLDTVKVVDIDAKRAQLFVSAMREALSHFDAEIGLCEDPDSFIGEADIITTATTSKKPVFEGRRVKKGAHINAVGAYTHEMQELDDYIVSHADKVIVDAREAAWAEAGDLILPLNKGIINEGRINGELGELLLGKVKGRENNEELTIFKTVGLAVLDIVTAHHIYHKAQSLGIGVQVEI